VADQVEIIVFRSAALGDFILACPALALLRRTHPGARIVLLTTQSASKQQRDKVASYAGDARQVPWVALAMPQLVDEVVVLDDVQSLAGLARGRRALAGRRFSRAVLLLDPASPWPGRLKKLLMMWLLVGWLPVLGWRGRGSLNGDRARLKADGVLRHHVHGPLQFLAEMKPAVRYDNAEVVFDLRPPEADNAWALAWCQQHQATPGQRWVAVAPGSIQPHKRWPLDNFKALCRQLLHDDPQLRIVVLGTPGDAPLGDALRDELGDQAINLAGQTSIARSAALLARCALLVGNDGGAMHLGDAMGARVVSIVPGIEYPDSIEPWHNRQRAVRHPVACAPCYDFTRCPLGHNKCMVDLPVSAVLARCREALAGAAP